MFKTDLTGETFGYWTVLGKDESFHGGQNTRWICRCKCGAIKSILRFTLTNGRSQSCGCKISDKRKGINKTHGMSRTRLYHEWVSMRKRCNDPNNKFAYRYCNRGIKVCREWNDHFEPFYEWAINNGYADDLTIDRIDNDKGYCPENCRWVSLDEQARNKSSNIFIEYQGKEWCLRTLCVEIGFPYKTAHRRYMRAKKSGKPIMPEKILEPIHKEKIAFRYRKDDC